MLLDVLLALFLTHVGRIANVRKQPASLRSDPGPHHRNRWPTSPECAASREARVKLAAERKAMQEFAPLPERRPSKRDRRRIIQFRSER